MASWKKTGIIKKILNDSITNPLVLKIANNSVTFEDICEHAKKIDLYTEKVDMFKQYEKLLTYRAKHRIFPYFFY
ncbi:hypothetical protein MFLO_07177 [Listeria floridensis FSL S10-1187]|uniref:Uncharacterized protein n=1 Tax=Listeria floridensis FSL S10-1187 TaxID=1265817 RepID=A0ABP3AYR7_9LIST|nr:hypothetical protein MFLO_07177 [Listeria floridensis FSL S10-1187]